MILFDRHRRFRSKLSAYIDGELSSDDARALDEHLESCDSCRLELDEIRATVDALRTIPEVDAPRSFRLTPQMVAEPRPATSWNPSPGLMNGMRMATAGLTMALVVVFVADLGGSGQGSREGGSLNQTVPMNFDADVDTAPTSADSGVGSAEPATGYDGPDELSGLNYTGAESPSNDNLEQNLGGAALRDTIDDGTDELLATGDEADTFSAPSDGEKMSGEAQAALSAASGDGFDEFLAAEIALGAALALAAAGTAGMTFARSRARRN